MKAFCAILFTLILSSHLFSQDIVGSTTIQINATTSVVTASCETDLNTADDGYYAARVTCTVVDSSGNIVASGT
jgi:hypothetical protein